MTPREFETTVQEKISRFHALYGMPPEALVVNAAEWRGFKIQVSATHPLCELSGTETYCGLRVITTIRTDVIAEVY